MLSMFLALKAAVSSNHATVGNTEVKGENTYSRTLCTFSTSLRGVQNACNSYRREAAFDPSKDLDIGDMVLPRLPKWKVNNRVKALRCSPRLLTSKRHRV